GVPLAPERAGFTRIPGFADDPDIHRMDLAIEIGKLGIGTDRLLSREAGGLAIETGLAGERYLRADPFQLLRHRFVIAAREGMLRVELDRHAEIGQRLRPVALP